MFFGNLFVFIKFQGKNHIDLETRNVVFGALTAVCVVGIVFLLLLRPIRRLPSLEDAKVKYTLLFTQLSLNFNICHVYCNYNGF